MDADAFECASSEATLAPTGLRVNIADERRIEFAELTNPLLISLFCSSNFQRLIFRLTGHVCSLNASNGIQLRRAAEGTSAFPPHVDTPPKGRALVSIFYLSLNWHCGEGGRVCLTPNEMTEFEAGTLLEPIGNRLLLFEALDHHWHNVEAIYSGERYSVVAEWTIERSFV